MPPDENIKAFAKSWLAKKPAKGFGMAMSISETEETIEEMADLWLAAWIT